MAGKNPYLPEQNIPGPAKPYKIYFKKPCDKVIEVKAGDSPNLLGLPSSILDFATAHGVDIDHACGGVAACSTCHVYVTKGLESCNDPIEAELDQLDNAPAQRFNSRLACQCVPDGSSDIEIEIPGWNRNAVKEGH